MAAPAKSKFGIAKPAIIGLSVAAFISLLTWLGVFYKNELWTLDQRYAIRPAPPSDTSIYTIVIDDNAIDQMGRWPWTWDRHALVLDFLRLYSGHQAAFVEPYFNELGTVTVQRDQARQIAANLSQVAKAGGQGPELIEGLIPDFNERFLRSVERFPNTFIGASFTIPEGEQAKDGKALENLAASNKQIFSQSKREAIASLDSFSLAWSNRKTLMSAVDINPVTPELSKRMSGAGFNRIIQDVDGIVRRTPLIVWYDGRVYPSLALSMAAGYFGCPLSEVKIIVGRHILIPGKNGTVRIPIDKKGNMLLNWVGTYQDSFRPLPYNLITYYYAYHLAKVHLRQFQFGQQPIPEVMQGVAQALANDRVVPVDEVGGIAQNTVLQWVMDYFMDRGATFDVYVNSTGQQGGEDLGVQQIWWNQMAVNKRTVEVLRAGQTPQYSAVLFSLGIGDTDRYRDAYDQTNHFVRTGRIHEVQPLYFLEPEMVGVVGQEALFSPMDLAGRTVFVGLTATGLNAYNPTPYQQRYPMFGMIPNTYNTIVTQKFLKTQAPQFEYLYILVYAVTVAWLVLHFRFLMGIVVMFVTSMFHVALGWIMFMTGGVIVPLFAPVLTVIVSAVAAYLYRYVEEARERKKVRGFFGAMVSPDILKNLEANPDKLRLGGEKFEATLFSSDVSGFTTISEGVTAQELANILNIYLTPMSNIIMTFDGYCDKYEGDAIKADYGVPVPEPNHAWKGCYAALLQQEELSVIQRLLLLKYGVKITARMGVNTGIVAAGMMGSEKRLQYTCMGEAVTIAEELEPINKLYETWIAIGPVTLEQSKTHVEVRHLDTVKMGHEGNALGVYELMGWKREKFMEHWKGKPIPPLVIEGWKKIMAEKILGYIYYWDHKKLPDSPFYRDMRAHFDELAPIAIEQMKFTDKANMVVLRADLEELQKAVLSHNELLAGKTYTKAGQAELEMIKKQKESAKDDALRILLEWKYRLKEEQFAVLLLAGQIPQERYEQLLQSVDTQQKRVECYIKRISFPKPEDKVGVDLADHLRQLIAGDGTAAVDPVAAQAKAEEIRQTIATRMGEFVAKVESRADEYHEFIADHCTVPEIRFKTRDAFARVRERYLKQDWDGAERECKATLELDPLDGPPMKYIERIAHLRKSPPPKDWDGVWAEE